MLGDQLARRLAEHRFASGLGQPLDLRIGTAAFFASASAALDVIQTSKGRIPIPDPGEAVSDNHNSCVNTWKAVGAIGGFVIGAIGGAAATSAGLSAAGLKGGGNVGGSAGGGAIGGLGGAQGGDVLAGDIAQLVCPAAGKSDVAAANAPTGETALGDGAVAGDANSQTDYANGFADGWNAANGQPSGSGDSSFYNNGRRWFRSLRCQNSRRGSRDHRSAGRRQHGRRRRQHGRRQWQRWITTFRGRQPGRR